MAKDTVRFIVDFTIDDGQLDAFEHISQEMTALTETEPGTLAYDWYLSGDRQRCRLYESYTDGNAVVAHLTGPVVQQLVPKLLGVSKLSGFEVYGDPGPTATEMLAGLGAELFQPWLAISR
jgi:quinol monooxygenase YgiN